MRTIRFSVLLISLLLLVSSCSIVQRRYMRGFHVEFARKSKPTERSKSEERRAKDKVVKVKEVCLTAESSEPLTNHSPTLVVTDLPWVGEKDKGNVLSIDDVTLRPPTFPLRPFSSSPFDSFAVVTIIISFLLCFIIPPLAMLLCFGAGNAFRKDLMLYLSGSTLLLSAAIYLLIIGGIVGATPFGMIVLLAAGIGLIAASAIYALVKLLKLAVTKTTD